MGWWDDLIKSLFSGMPASAGTGGGAIPGGATPAAMRNTSPIPTASPGQASRPVAGRPPYQGPMQAPAGPGVLINPAQVRNLGQDVDLNSAEGVKMGQEGVTSNNAFNQLLKGSIQGRAARQMMEDQALLGTGLPKVPLDPGQTMGLGSVLGGMRRSSGYMPNDSPIPVKSAYDASSGGVPQANRFTSSSPIKIGFMNADPRTGAITPDASDIGGNKTWSGKSLDPTVDINGSTSDLDQMARQEESEVASNPRIGLMKKPASWNQWDSGSPDSQPSGAASPLPAWAESAGSPSPAATPANDALAGLLGVPADYLRQGGYQSRPQITTTEPDLNAVRAAELERQKALTAGSRIGMRRALPR